MVLSNTNRLATTFRSAPERARSEAFLAESSLPEFCRAIINLNEFAFLD